MTGSDSPAAHALQTPPLELPLHELLERLGGEHELLVTLAQMQVAEAPRSLQEIRTYLESGDASAVERAAHRLVGSLIVFGADEAVAAARAVEHFGREGNVAEARERFPRLEFEVQRVTAALDRVAHTSQT
jgi:HPt (histidine-containing phosphotransfer) domain-containing protein